ncbi:MAG: phosphoribosyltransferase [Chloroflexi bacterium]|nr:phosphoribosyltransferase [Chloroflexota bacterium]MBV9597423.1 phosphoribosyltransferase [Chloroflexota bacterium]
MASKLTELEGPDTVVLGLPRGGVPVAYEVAVALRAPLDVFVVRKLGVPGHEELAMGAIASGGVRVVNRSVIEELGIPRSVFDAVAADEQQELERRERLYREQRPPLEVRNKSVIVTDDGLATGSTMRAATAALRQREPTRIVVAAPVAAAATCAALRPEVDAVVTVIQPEPFHGVGAWYADFRQTTDDEVRALLSAAAGA